MDMTILVKAGLAAGAVGLFLASYHRFSRPARITVGRDRRAPELAPELAAGPSGHAADAEPARRAPSL